MNNILLPSKDGTSISNMFSCEEFFILKGPTAKKTTVRKSSLSFNISDLFC